MKTEINLNYVPVVKMHTTVMTNAEKEIGPDINQNVWPKIILISSISSISLIIYQTKIISNRYLMTNYYDKYLKYKYKLEDLSNKIGGNTDINVNIIPNLDSGNGDEKVKRHLALYEYLNFKGMNNQDWSIVRAIYDPNVEIVMAGGETTKGIENNIKGMKQMYEMAPDTKVISQDIQFGSGDWTAISQVMTGTVSASKYFDGRPVKPGSKFKMVSCSLVQWVNNRIVKEIIYWDEGKFLKEIGVTN